MTSTTVTEEELYRSFVTRMWLDYSDEFSDPISAPDRMDRDEYAETYKDWLQERYEKSSKLESYVDYIEEQGKVTDLNWDGQEQGTYRYQK